MKIYRTATFAWSPTSPLPLIATGTVAGALDESFSNESQLEIWEPAFASQRECYGNDDSKPKGVVKDTSRCWARFLLRLGCYIDLLRLGSIVLHGDRCTRTGHLASSLLVWKTANLSFGIQQRSWNIQSRKTLMFHVSINPSLSISASEALILRNTNHTGPVRGLDFNPIQTNLLSSGAVNGEVRDLFFPRCNLTSLL